MAQHDYVIANDTAANVRADINLALLAIASNNSGAAAPATTYANQWWYDTSSDTLKIRSEANDAWISVAVLDQTNGRFAPVFAGPIEFADGSAAAPSLTNTGDTNTGLFFPAADVVGIATAGSERVRVDASGNVGIGTNAPQAKLHALDTLKVSSADQSSGNVILGDGGSTSFNVGVGRWNGATNAAGAGGMGYFAQGAGNGGGHYFYTGDAAAGSTTERLRVDTSGSLILAGSTAQKATGTTWSNPSDQRLKTNIVDYPKGITELMQVRVCEWEYNGKGGTTAGMKGLGVIADEVMTVLPDTVETYDAKLNADDEKTTAIKKFDATEITWLLVKAVQEQQALITALTARVAALEA